MIMIFVSFIFPLCCHEMAIKNNIANKLLNEIFPNFIDDLNI